MPNKGDIVVRTERIDDKRKKGQLVSIVENSDKYACYANGKFSSFRMATAKEIAYFSIGGRNVNDMTFDPTEEWKVGDWGICLANKAIGDSDYNRGARAFEISKLDNNNNTFHYYRKDMNDSYRSSSFWSLSYIRKATDKERRKEKFKIGRYVVFLEGRLNGNCFLKYDIGKITGLNNVGTGYVCEKIICSTKLTGNSTSFDYEEFVKVFYTEKEAKEFAGHTVELQGKTYNFTNNNKTETNEEIRLSTTNRRIKEPKAIRVSNKTRRIAVGVRPNGNKISAKSERREIRSIKIRSSIISI